MAQKKKDKKSGSGSGVDLKDRSKAKHRIAKPRKFKCVMHNDDYTPMDVVVYLLVDVFLKSIDDATILMLAVHEKGRGIAGVYSKEIAETKCQKAIDIARGMGYPFKITAEPE